MKEIKVENGVVKRVGEELCESKRPEHCGLPRLKPKVISISLTEEMDEKLEYAASAHDCTKSEFIKRALRYYLCDKGEWVRPSNELRGLMWYLNDHNGNEKLEKRLFEMLMDECKRTPYDEPFDGFIRHWCGYPEKFEEVVVLSFLADHMHSLNYDPKDKASTDWFRSEMLRIIHGRKKTGLRMKE